MRALCSLALVVTLASTTAPIAGADCVWGSFVTSRISYSAGALTGSAHSTLREIITANGGTIGAPAFDLTADYLSGVQVFYTSILSTGGGALSAAEQAALQAWIAGGETLIVTADISDLDAYESFTSSYGITNYTILFHPAGIGNVVAAHPITEGVTTYSYDTECTFSFGSDALLLGDNGFGDPFMVVLEPSTGFNIGGRVLVFGDHYMFTNFLIGQADNTRLATNMAM
jgi:hypothetical protein